MRRTREEATRTRQAILDAALEIFSQRGYQATRLQDIAKVTGVTRGAIYHHFSDKRGLFLKVLEETAARESDVVDRTIAEGGSLVDIMTRILTYSVAQLEEDRQLRQAYKLSAMNIMADHDLVAVRRQQVEQKEQRIDSIASLIAQGIIMGELREDLDPMLVARAFIAYQNGVATLWLDDQEAFSLKEKAGELAVIFMKGVQAS